MGKFGRDVFTFLFSPGGYDCAELLGLKIQFDLMEFRRKTHNRGEVNPSMDRIKSPFSVFEMGDV
jgi:hypothetical protein